ncbi:M14 family zinc carboxypeptidase [Bacteroidota bacterium]
MTKKLLLAILTVLFLVPVQSLFSQTGSNDNEVYFTFDIGFPAELEALTKIISIDNVQGAHIFAYANNQGFNRFKELGYTYTILPHPGSLLSEAELRPPGSGKELLTTWDYYPSYDEYISFMNDFVTSHPDICKLVPIGTSIQGREIIAVKISDNVNNSDPEPEFFYTSSIHGDETTGYVLMLHLIDHILNNYGVDQRITDMVDHTEIFINPLANPDGTYWGGNNSVYQARRFNANGIDLNRNYPDPEDGPHPDGNAWQPETIAFMAFADTNHFVMGANFHGGEEVFNYPWDTWSKLAADDAWWQFVGHEYVDTVHIYAPWNYFSGFNNGITNGYQWYTISGGRQDYMNYWHSDREVTLEISDIKLLPANQLLNYWEYNYRSLLTYIDEVNYGVQGVVTDSVTGEPLQARVLIPGYDIDNSYVDTKLPSGFYSRLLYEGAYGFRFSATGYFPKTIYDISVTNHETTYLDVQMVPLNVAQDEPRVEHLSMVYPNPSAGMIDVTLPEKEIREARVECFGITGNQVLSTQLEFSSGQTSFKLNLGNLPSGLYVIKLSTGMSSYIDRIIIR